MGMKEELAASLLQIEHRQTQKRGERFTRAHNTVQFSLPLASMYEAEVLCRDVKELGGFASMYEAEVLCRDVKARGLLRALSDFTPSRESTGCSSSSEEVGDLGQRLQRRFTLAHPMSAEWREEMDSELDAAAASRS